MPMEFHTKHRTLTAAEIASAKDGVVTHMQQIAILDGELAEQKKKYANLLKPHKTTVKELITMITTGVESGSAYCNVVVDPVTQTVKFFETKRVFNEDTQRYENVETLFDEKTFEEVGEKQLTIWQEESERDVIDDAMERIDHEEWMSLDKWIAKFCNENGGFVDTEDLARTLASPFPTPVADWYLKETGAPSSNVNIALSSQGLRAALKVLEIDLTGDGHAYNYLAEKLSGMLFSDTVNGQAILSMMIEWANTEDSDDEDESGDDE